MEIIFDSLSNATSIVAQNLLTGIYDQTFGAAGEWLQDALMNALTFVMSIVFMIPYYLTKWSVWGLDKASTIRTSHDVLQNGWQISIYFVNIMAIFFLIILAFANSLRLNIETYEIKKTLPALIAGFIIANLSFLIINVLLDVSDLTVDIFNKGFSVDCPLACQLAEFTTGMPARITESGWPQITDNPLEEMTESILLIGAMAAPAILMGPAAPGYLIIVFFLGFLLLILPAILILILCLIAIARYIILFILITIAPIAIILYSFPPTKSLGQKWIEQLFLWIFLTPIIYFVLYLGAQFGKEQEFVVFGYLTNNFVELAHAANNIDIGEAVGILWSDVFYALIKYVAGLAFLFAALYLPFQIGGFGQSIISGLRDLGKKGGLFAWESGGLKENVGYALEKGEIKAGALPGLKKDMKIPFIGSTLEKLGKSRAVQEAKKTRAGKDLASAQRLNNIEATEKIGDMKNVARLRDKEMMKTWKDTATEENFRTQFANLQKNPGWNDFMNGKGANGGIQETGSNLLGALRQISLDASAGKERQNMADRLLGEFMAPNGIEFDDYMNIINSGNINGNNQATNLGVAKTTLGLDEENLAEIAGTGLPRRTTLPPDADGLIAGKYKNYNDATDDDSKKINNVNNLYNKIHADAQNNIKMDADKFAASTGNLSTSQLKEIVDKLTNGGKNVDYAKELAKDAGSKKLDELLNRLHTDDKTKQYIPADNNIFNYQVKEAIKKTADARETIQNNVTNSSFYSNPQKIETAEGLNRPLNSTEQVVFNEVKNIYNDYKDGDNFNTINSMGFTADNHQQNIEKFFDSKTNTTKEFKKEIVKNQPEIIRMIDSDSSGKDIYQKLKNRKMADDLKPHMAMFVQAP